MAEQFPAHLVGHRVELARPVQGEQGHPVVADVDAHRACHDVPASARSGRVSSR
jgi:hypothetical protein